MRGLETRHKQRYTKDDSLKLSIQRNQRRRLENGPNQNQLSKRVCTVRAEASERSPAREGSRVQRQRVRRVYLTTCVYPLWGAHVSVQRPSGEPRSEIVYDDRSAHVNPLILNHVWRKRDSRNTDESVRIPTDPTGPNAAVQRTQFYRALYLAHVSSDVTGRL